MDSAKYPKTDSAVMLLNEIEILLAQTRLMELYLKQSQLTAENETARFHGQYQTELGILRSAVAEKERTLAADLTAGSQTEKNFREQIRDLENRLGEKQRRLEDRDAELKSLQSTSANLQGQIAELENAQRRAQSFDQEAATFRQGLQAELLGLRKQLEKNQDDYQTEQLSSRGLQEKLETQLAQLQDQLKEKQADSQTISTELERARLETAALYSQLTELQASSRQAQLIAAQELAQASERFALEIASLQAALAARDHSLLGSENAFAEIERGLKTEIVALRSQLEQRQELIEFRDDELRDVHGQLAALQQRVVELESSHDSIAANAQEIDSLQRSFEGEIAALQHEVAFKERALSERQEAVAAAELALQSKIQALQEELTRSRGAIAQGELELDNARAEAASLRRRFDELEATAAAADLAARQLDEEKNRGVELESELARLNATLAQKEYALKEQENVFRSAEERLGGEINQLRDQLAQRQIEAESTGAELARLRAEIAALHEQNIQSDLARRQLEDHSQHTAMQREELENRLRAKDEEIRAAQERQEAALGEQENQFRSAEDRRSAEVKALCAGLDERQILLDQARAELEQLRSEIAELREQNSRSELAQRQLEENWQRTVASERGLTASLQAKEQELSLARAAANELKSQHDVATGELQLQLAERGLLAQSCVMEIGNLKAEIQRLSEQLSQRESVASQATADFHREMESSRAAHQAELAALRQEHRAKQEELENERGQEKQNITELRNRLEEIERHTSEAEAALTVRDQDLLAGTSEVVVLRARIHELETQSQSETATARNEADQARMQSEAELAALRNDVQQKSWALAQQQATMENLALAQRNQIQKLEARLAEQQNNITERNLDIERAQSQTRPLQRRIEELESELQHAQLSGIAQAEQVTRQSASQIDELSQQLAQKSAEIQERTVAQSTLEQSLRNEIDRLIRETHEKNQILQDRNDEVVRVKAEMDLLLDRLSQLESSASQTEVSLTGDLERMRGEFQAQLALLQAELSQKEWALEEREATARGLQQKYLDEIGSLRQQLAEKNIAKTDGEREFVMGEPRIKSGQNQAFDVEQNAKSVDGQTNSSGQERRWQGGFGWKRRWKSEQSRHE